MNEFERQIRSAISAARTGVRQAEHSLTNPIWQAKSTAASIGGIIPAGMRGMGNAQPQDDDQPEFTAANEDPPVSSVNRAQGKHNPLPPMRPSQQREHQQGSRTTGQNTSLFGLWHNPYVSAAMPLLLQIEWFRNEPETDFVCARLKIVRKLEFFRKDLRKQGFPPEEIDHLSYLICTYADGLFTDMVKEEMTGLSLLVEFHKDAWGGENCFEHLKEYISNPQDNRDVLEFYYLILSMGFEGKYRMLERGAVLLMDLRNHLSGLLYAQNTTLFLSDVRAEKVKPPKRRFITALRILITGLILAVIAYGISAWYLHEQARQIRNDILAWVPPEPRKINIMETLPNPLTQILNEGWLEVRKDPRGWLLIFTSDGAFLTGKSELTEDFLSKRNIERLGAALAPWPGDLEVIGHTDATPFRKTSANNNLKLSEARAVVVADILRTNTMINQTHNREITATGRGESDPIADNTTDEGRKRNRRVDILWKIGKRDAEQAMQGYQDSDVPAVLNNTPAPSAGNYDNNTSAEPPVLPAWMK